jgi:uncharacterized membrane protein YwzB
MVALIGWVVFLIMFYCFAYKSIKMFEHFLKKKAKTQADDELFKYMLEKHWEPWAKFKGILK